MAPAYWTHCMYCGGMICGVEVLQAYPDVVVLCGTRHAIRVKSGIVRTATTLSSRPWPSIS